MLIRDFYLNKNFVLSFEVFPPKNNNEIEPLYKTITELKELKPDFVSVTYGAGGGTKEKTVEITSKIKNEIKIEAMAHLTCVNTTKEQIELVLSQLKEKNIQNILALRGDPPLGEEKIYKGDFKYAYQLVEFIKKNDNWSIGVAGYPEGHPDSKNLEEDVNYLKLKIDSGADFVITQLFYDNTDFYKFLDLARKKGINKPIIPGIFPIFNFNTIKKITSLCKAKIPSNLYSKLEKNQDNIEETEKIGIEYAINQAQELINNGVNGLHFYTMNKSRQIKIIISQLSFKNV